MTGDMKQMTTILSRLNKVFAVTLTIAAIASSVQAQSQAEEQAQIDSRAVIYAEETIDLPRRDVWEDWSTPEGLESFFAQEALIDMRPGGDYIIVFDENAPEGSKGNDYGQVLGFQYENMLHVTWSMPPYMPKIRPHLTSLQLEFNWIDDDTTQLRLFHTGFGDSNAWDEGIAYFETVWPAVLSRYKEIVEAEAKDEKE